MKNSDSSMVHKEAPKRSRLQIYFRRFRWAIIILVVGLIAARAMLPYFVIRYVNRTLKRIPEYDGSIRDVHISLIRGAYVIYGLKLVKTTGKVPVPLLEAETIEFSVQWRALLEGKWVGEIELENGKLNFVNGPTDKQSQTSVDNEWLKAVKDLFPLRLNRFALKNVLVSYRDFSSTPNVNVSIKNTYVEGKDFNNTRTPQKGLSSPITARGMVEGVSPIKVETLVDPSSHEPTFDLKASLEKLPLTSLNDFFKAYGNFDVHGGTGAMYMTLKVRDGNLEGNVKPIIKDIKIIDLTEEDESIGQKFWELAVGAAAELFENQRKDQLATIIPLEGKMTSIKDNSWETFVGILKNAFLRALKPGVVPLDQKASE